MKRPDCVDEEQQNAPNETAVKKAKGQIKQEQYIAMIKSISNSEDLEVTNTQRKLLKICSNYPNVPRKLPKFQMFLKNVARSLKYSEADLQAIFNLLEERFKNIQAESNLISKDSIIFINNDSSCEAPAKKGKKRKNEGSNKNENTLISNEENLKTKKIKSKKGIKNENGTIVKKTDNGTAKKIAKKRKHETAITESKIKMARTLSSTAGGEKPAPFDWEKAVVRVLESQANHRLPLKLLAKKTLQEYAKVSPPLADPDARKLLYDTFHKRVKKTPGVVVLKGRASLKIAEGQG